MSVSSGSKRRISSVLWRSTERVVWLNSRRICSAVGRRVARSSGLAQLLSPNGIVWQVTEPTPDALKRLKSLQIHKPPPILQLA
jgi:hypothetical protein